MHLITSFNSIKVRLRLISYCGFCPSGTCFNSIKVRLRLKQGSSTSPTIKFQFHKGTIKTYSARLLLRDRCVSIP